jgi:glycosyltransferase involved in cell wall biosynthesis
MPVRVAVLALGPVSRDTGGRSYLEGVLGPLGADPELDVAVHASDPAFAVPGTCTVVRHRVPPGTAGRLAAEARVARAASRSADLVLAPLNFLPPLVRGPSVVVEHNILSLPSGVGQSRDVSRLRRLYRPRALAHTLRRATAAAVVSEHLRDRLAADFAWLDPGRLHVVPLGVSEEIRAVGAAREPRPGTRILVVSALWDYKRVDLAIQALAHLAPRLPDARLEIAGPGNPRRARLEALANGLGIGDRVTFLGNVPTGRMPALYADADVLLHLSEIESFPLPVLEGLAAGLPVVARRLPPLLEVGQDVPLWLDATVYPAAVADALERALTDEELRADAARRGPERAAPFTWERTAGLLADVIRTAARAESVGAPSRDAEAVRP